ncbi:uncharacterized protein LMH87_009186 [Akanthomyces muscarius]|uniref:Tyrosinase copper-binding domain-containing protein n=1 Tax=Akanthomyces muscarius TaxID=2231603 RepID=A0A9W8QL67_AKAMU|nr:uncharacterized protein LMH87_009186 [Akanthomyces muscarius]KAJ4158670.1 hypothetical protein LMH87_009186 [Akanthomyces muscarius]
MQVTTTAAAVVVTGVKVDAKAPSVPPRRSIVDLHSNGGAQWDLYIQALGAMQAANLTDPESWFQVSGIHGMPYIEYDHTGGPQNTGSWQGYCPHSEALFLPWHRAYSALFEQTLASHAKRIAMTYPEEHRARYIEAADTLRSPYWDWAADVAVPEATVPQALNINVAVNGKLEAKDVENPLHTFKFPQAALEGEFGEFGEFNHEQKKQMYRCNGPDESYPGTPNEKLKTQNYKGILYDAFTRSADFHQFSSTASPGPSLEAAHGGIHWDAACGGQFLSFQYTGFDPLFTLHHNNVDRLWAYWQALHPDQELFSGDYLGGDRWATSRNTTITTNSPLQPFRRDRTEFHTSETVLSIHEFGYSYHGLETRDSTSDQRREEVTRIVNGLQPPFAMKKGRRASRQPDRPRDMLTRYFAHVSVELSEVERPSSIEVSMNGTYVGNLALMSMPDCGVVYGEIRLDSVCSTLRGKSTRVILETLESWLQVEIIKADGSKLSLAAVPSLKVEIEQVQVAVPRSDIELPEYSASRFFGIKVANRSYQES